MRNKKEKHTDLWKYSDLCKGNSRRPLAVAPLRLSFFPLGAPECEGEGDERGERERVRRARRFRRVGAILE